MSINKQMPIDANAKPIPGSILGAAIAVTYDTSVDSASNVTLNAATTWIEVAAIGKGLFMRYASGASSSAFDEFIPADTVRGFARPDGVTVVSVIEEATSAHAVIIEK